MFIINVSLKRMTSFIITPVPQSSVPGFAASKVSSPWLGVFIYFILFHFSFIYVFIHFFLRPSRFTVVIASPGISDY